MITRGHPALVLAVLVLVALTLGGCGMRGPLYLPPPPGPAPSTVPEMPIPDQGDSRR
ncbi:MAG: lipoprotein [Burkholderiaceae bacterium]|jgi:predicted small lipoprotein YifL|nr:lipoprotein [Gemmatimonadales bacterium]MCO5120510.1 lipoprotein [Burkholderiaceae bacterium]MEB2320073.1 lipoprotein [Pseudomonadota bacterium]